MLRWEEEDGDVLRRGGDMLRREEEDGDVLRRN